MPQISMSRARLSSAALPRARVSAVRRMPTSFHMIE